MADSLDDKHTDHISTDNIAFTASNNAPHTDLGLTLTLCLFQSQDSLIDPEDNDCGYLAC